MKICFFGLGSIGSRHLKNLCSIANEKSIGLRIHAFRRTQKPLNDGFGELIEKSIYTEDDIESDYDIVFITNPTSNHFDTIKFMKNKAKNMFIEKPLVDYKEYNFNDIIKINGTQYVAGPLRFSNVIQELNRILKNEQVYCVRAICSSYLPDWRPNTDYRQIYSAKKDCGGGVRIDLIHDWDYITYLFGFPQDVKCIYGKYSNLEIDSDDIAVYIAKYKDKVVEVHLDYFGRVPRRDIEIFTPSGTIIGDLVNQTITFSDKTLNIEFNSEKNSMYIKEMEFFLDNVLNSNNYNNLMECKKVLDLAKGEEIE